MAAPDDMQVPSPDGRYVLEVNFTGGGLTFRRGLGADLALRHASGAAAPLGSLHAVQGLEIVWSGPRTLRICARNTEPPPSGPVTVDTPTGPETFAVSYVCPAQTVPTGPFPGP
ncbi:MAG: hypothetical protein Q8J81_00235 [Phenylobacterium sp.]|nr:hypothetical protein [Phenylobacterium sp.]